MFDNGNGTIVLRVLFGCESFGGKILHVGNDPSVRLCADTCTVHCASVSKKMTEHQSNLILMLKV